MTLSDDLVTCESHVEPLQCECHSYACGGHFNSCEGHDNGNMIIMLKYLRESQTSSPLVPAPPPVRFPSGRSHGIEDAIAVIN